ncbi:hypothetical protein N2152v2_005920 [Parachlorella kessleri]
MNFVSQFLRDLSLDGVEVHEREACLGHCGQGPNVLVVPSTAGNGAVESRQWELSQMSHPADILRALDDICGIHVDSAGLAAAQLRLAGVAAARRGDATQAAGLFTEALELNPSQGRHLLLTNRAGARLSLGDASAALQDAWAAAEIAPASFPYAHIRQAEAFLQLCRGGEALQALEVASERCPGLTGSPVFQGLIERVHQQHELGLQVQPSLGALLASHPFIILAAVAGGVALGWLLLRLLAEHSLGITRAAALVLGIAALVGLVVLVGEAMQRPVTSPLLAYVIFMLAAILVALMLLLALGWRRVELAGRLLGVATRNLNANPALFLLLGVTVLVNCVVIGALLVLLVLAASDGQVLVGSIVEPPKGAWCDPALKTGRHQLCWVPTWRFGPTVGLLAWTVCWLAAFSTQLLLYVVAGVAAQWHGSQGAAGQSLESGNQLQVQPGMGVRGGAWTASKQRLRISVGHALGPSLGSLTVASMPLASPVIFQVQALARAKDEVAAHGWLAGILWHIPARCLRGWLVSASLAATVVMAWTGESFLGSAKAAADLISWRALLVVFYTVWVNSVTIQVLSYVLNQIWALLLLLSFSVGGGKVDASGSLSESLFMNLVAQTSYLIVASCAALLLHMARAVVLMWIAERKEMTEVAVEHQPLATAGPFVGPTPGRASEVDEVLEPLMGFSRPSEGIECGQVAAVDGQL